MEVKTIIKQKGFTIEAVAKNGYNKSYTCPKPQQKSNSRNITKIADVIGCKVGDFFVDDMDIKDDANTITCPHCGGKIHFDGEKNVSRKSRED